MVSCKGSSLNKILMTCFRFWESIWCTFWNWLRDFKDKLLLNEIVKKDTRVGERPDENAIWLMCLSSFRTMIEFNWTGVAYSCHAHTYTHQSTFICYQNNSNKSIIFLKCTMTHAVHANPFFFFIHKQAALCRQERARKILSYRRELSFSRSLSYCYAKRLTTATTHKHNNCICIKKNFFCCCSTRYKKFQEGWIFFMFRCLVATEF